MRVIFVASEAAPIAKVGGLADVVGSLPKALAKLGVKVKIIIPKYGTIDKDKFGLKKAYSGLEVFFDHKLENFNVWRGFLPGTSSLPADRQVEMFFIENQLLSSNGIYLSADATPGSFSELTRFAFFQQASTTFLDEVAPDFDILHCHDWHTALIADLVKVKFKPPHNLAKIATILTIHNLGVAYQGIADPTILGTVDLDIESLSQIEKNLVTGDVNFLQQGIESANILTTVSPQYAAEIQTAEFGGKLAPILKRRADVLYGILNGIDYETFNPATDSNLVKTYQNNSWVAGKAANKNFLKREASLAPGEQILIGVVTRIDEQKGLDLIFKAADQILALNSQIVILGTGNLELENQFRQLEEKNYGNFSFFPKFDTRLASQIYAGADCFLMPSRFEPCGLGQMIAMRYGTIPIVRDVGGLHDTVEDGVTGFKFSKLTSDALISVVGRVVNEFKNRDSWKKLVQNSMSKDFSWDKSATEYVKLYEQAILIKSKSKM